MKLFPAGWLCDMPLTERILSISCDFTEVMSLIRDKPATLHHTSDKALSPQPCRQCQFATVVVSSCGLLEVNCYSTFTAFSCYCDLLYGPETNKRREEKKGEEKT